MNRKSLLRLDSGLNRDLVVSLVTLVDPVGEFLRRASAHFLGRIGPNRSRLQPALKNQRIGAPLDADIADCPVLSEFLQQSQQRHRSAVIMFGPSSRTHQ